MKLTAQMIYGAILAGGVGRRMVKHSIPKQFIELRGKPIILYTIGNMLMVGELDALYVAVHPEYKAYLADLLKRWDIHGGDRVRIIEGGKERLDTIQQVVNAVARDGSGPDDIVVFHDAVRPFTPLRVIRDSIEKAREYGLCVATVPCVDTMYMVNEEGCIVSAPERKFRRCARFYANRISFV